MPDRKTITSRAPLNEFRQTIVMRLLVSIFLAPFGLGAIFLTKHDGFDVWYVVGLLLCATTALVWANGIMFRLLVYPDFLIRKNLFGTTTVALTEKTKLFHKNAQEYVNGAKAGSHVFITVNDGKNKLKLDSDLKGIDVLQEWLVSEELQRYYDKRYLEYRSGKLMDFGELKLHAGKLIYKDKSIPLSEIEKAQVERGILKVTVPGKMLSFCKIPIAKIANMTTFFRMMEDAIANVSPTTSPTATPSVQPPLIQSETYDTKCPNCNKAMQKRRANSGPHAGKLFWVCTAYPECKGMAPATD